MGWFNLRGVRGRHMGNRGWARGVVVAGGEDDGHRRQMSLRPGLTGWSKWKGCIGMYGCDGCDGMDWLWRRMEAQGGGE